MEEEPVPLEEGELDCDAPRLTVGDTEPVLEGELEEVCVAELEAVREGVLDMVQEGVKVSGGVAVRPRGFTGPTKTLRKASPALAVARSAQPAPATEELSNEVS